VWGPARGMRRRPHRLRYYSAEGFVKKPILLSFIPVALALAAGGAAAQAPSPEARAGQRAGAYELPVARTVAGKYLLFLPRGYDRSRQRWPLIVYLHGGSMRGTDPERLRRWGVPHVADADSSFPFIVLSPLLPERQLWTDTDALIALLDDIQARYRVDPRRVYLTGHSLGGNGAWYLAYRHPERFAAVAPMAGPANAWWSTRLKDVPLWVFHGAADDVVPLKESREMVDALRKEGAADLTFTVLPGRGHDILDAFENRELYAWFLRHRRP
jgi:predicted peptidase